MFKQKKKKNSDAERKRELERQWQREKKGSERTIDRKKERNALVNRHQNKILLRWMNDELNACYMYMQLLGSWLHGP